MNFEKSSEGKQRPEVEHKKFRVKKLFSLEYKEKKNCLFFLIFYHIRQIQ